MKKLHFSSFELLIVIAIIGTLAAMILPLLDRRHRPAYNALCKSNLKQIGTSVAIYFADEQEVYFPVNEFRLVQEGGPMEIDKNILICPTRPAVIRPTTRSAPCAWPAKPVAGIS